jgi:hypothetical protein
MSACGKQVSVMAVLIALSCGGGPRVIAPLATSTPFCASYVIQLDGRDIAAQGCAETQPLCERARAAAHRFGSLAGIVAIGPCIDERLIP